MNAFRDFIVESNDPKKLYDLVRLSGGFNDTHIGQLNYSIPHCASLVQCPAQIIGATHDRISDLTAVRDLHAAIPSSQLVVMDTGHLAPFEKPNEWIDHILSHSSDITQL